MVKNKNLMGRVLIAGIVTCLILSVIIVAIEKSRLNNTRTLKRITVLYDPATEAIRYNDFIYVILQPQPK